MTQRYPLLLLACFALAGCGSKDIGPKTEFSEQEKQQIEEYQQQATDEWGRKVK